MTDIVVTYLNERYKQWQNDFTYWKNKEIEEGIQTPDNRQAFGEERTREWDAFKYWFRGIEKCCPWVNKVILVVQNENHIPEWLDTNNPKLKVVYHSDYVPGELLPTYNAMTICMYFGYIKDLQEQFIVCDDDYYFLNPITEDKFFKDGKPVHLNNKIPYGYYGLGGTDYLFFKTLNNSLDFEKKYMTNKIKYGFYHLPEARLKSFEKKILDDNKEEIYKRNIISKFRHSDNLCPNMFSDLLKICGKAVFGNPYSNSCYCDLKSTVNFDDYWNKDMVCFNDTERVDDYDKTKEKFIDFLERKFPDKSSFEK